MWALGDYSAVSPMLEPYGIGLAARCGITPGLRVLDVAAGNGNFALAAARLGAVVTATDLTPRMLELGRARTIEAGETIEWLEGDAEDLPVPDGDFDLVASVFGAMFAPRPERVASEMFRATRPGGLVAMANYGWDGFLGSFAKLLGRYAGPGPAGVPAPFEWGDEEVVRKRFGDLAARVDVQPGVVTQAFGSVDDALDFWERTNGPQIALKTMLPPDRYADFKRDAEALVRESNQSHGGGLELRSAYINVMARK